MATELLGIVEISSSQSQKYVSHNEGLHHLEVHITGVLDRDNSGPPGSPSAGDAYIVDSATGVWSTATVDDVAYYYGTSPSWYFYTPVEGVTLHVADEHRDYIYDGSDWIPAHRESGVSLIARNTVGMQTADGSQNMFTVPTGKKLIIDHVIVRSATASLVGGSDYDFGTTATDWATAISLVALTGATLYHKITQDDTAKTIYDAAAVIRILPNTGSTANADATIDVFGYLYDA